MENFFLPVVFHNLKCYDAHFIIKHFKKKYTEAQQKRHYFERLKDEDGNPQKDNNGKEVRERKTETKTVYNDVEVTSLNSEKYLSFSVDCLHFLDSFQFLSTSLQNLVDMLKGKEDDPSKLTHKFVHTSKHIKTQHRLTYAKGVYPYSYVSGPEKFAETSLPPIKSFYGEPLSSEDDERAKQIWEVFDIKTLQQYHEHYLKTDVLLLADVFENYRNTIYGKHRLDSLHFITLPSSLAWTTALKRTGAKLDLITDPDMYLMIENNMRGGIATISHHHAVANNPSMNDEYDPSKPHSFITYLDQQSLWHGDERTPSHGGFRVP